MKNCLLVWLALTCLNVSAVGAETVDAGGSAGGGAGQVGKPTTVKIDGVDDELEVTGHWGRCPTVLPIGRPKEHPPVYRTNRQFFPGKHEHWCGVFDASIVWIHDNEKQFKPALNKTYTIYKASDFNRERPVGGLTVLNGNGFVDNLVFGPLENSVRRFGQSMRNELPGGPGDPLRPEMDVFVFELDCVDNATGSFSKFRLAAYAPGGLVSEFALEGPGIVCATPLTTSVQSVMQYIPDMGVFWVGVRDENNRNYSITEIAALQNLLKLVEKKIVENRDITPIQKLEGSGVTSGRSERHQKTSPTLPEGAPIPDSR